MVYKYLYYKIYRNKYYIVLYKYQYYYVLVLSSTIRKGADSAQDAYENAKDKTSVEAYNKFYDIAFASAERKYHVSNKVSIEVASVREEANLEVLHVSDVEFVIESTSQQIVSSTVSAICFYFSQRNTSNRYNYSSSDWRQVPRDHPS